MPSDLAHFVLLQDPQQVQSFSGRSPNSVSSQLQTNTRMLRGHNIK